MNREEDKDERIRLLLEENATLRSSLALRLPDTYEGRTAMVWARYAIDAESQVVKLMAKLNKVQEIVR